MANKLFFSDEESETSMNDERELRTFMVEVCECVCARARVLVCVCV